MPSSADIYRARKIPHTAHREKLHTKTDSRIARPPAAIHSAYNRYGRRVVRALSSISTTDLHSSVPTFQPNSAIGIRIGIIRNRHGHIRIFRNIIVHQRNKNIQRSFAIHGIDFKINIRHAFPIRDPVVSRVRVIDHKSIHHTGLCCLHRLHKGTTGVHRGHSGAST